MAYQQEQRRGNDGPGARGLSSISRVDVALLLGLTIAAAVLYASNLTTVSLWSDEGVTARVMAMSPRHFALYLLFGEPSYIGYYLVLRPWVAIVGTSEAGLRSLSAACALGTVPLVYLIGRQLAASRLVAVGASALLVANAMALHYAVEARAYALVLLLVTAATWLLLRAMERPTRARWIVYGIVLTAATWVHFYAVFVVVAHGLYLWWRRDAALRTGMLTVLFSLLASIPIAILIALWGPARDWLEFPTVANLGNTLASAAGFDPAGALGPLLPLAYALAVGVMALLVLRESRRVVPGGRHAAILPLLWLAVPISAGLLVSLVKPIFITRSLIVVVPALALLLALAASRLPWRWLGVAVVAAVVGLSAQHMSAERSTNPDWRSAVSALGPLARDGDALLVFPPGQPWWTARYYVRRTADIARVKILNSAGIERDQAAATVSQASSDHDRVWVLARQEGDHAPAGIGPVLQQLRRLGYTQEDGLSFYRLNLRLFSR